MSELSPPKAGGRQGLGWVPNPGAAAAVWLHPPLFWSLHRNASRGPNAAVRVSRQRCVQLEQFPRPCSKRFRVSFTPRQEPRNLAAPRAAGAGGGRSPVAQAPSLQLGGACRRLPWERSCRSRRQCPQDRALAWCPWVGNTPPCRWGGQPVRQAQPRCVPRR